MKFSRCVCLIFLFLTGTIVYAATPQVNSTNPVSGPVGTHVQINGSGFGATRGASTVAFFGISASVVSWSDTQIVAIVPTTATTGYISVTAGGVTSNTSVDFNVPPPQITSISPASGVIGTQVTVTGSGFQATKGASSSITFNGITATTTSWSDTQIVATVPANATTGAVKVSVNNIVSNQNQVFTLPNPLISGITPSSGPVGTIVHLSGSGFGATQGTSTLQFRASSGSANATVTTWNDTSITATVPPTAVSGNLAMSVGGVPTSSNVQFTIPPPQVVSITPATGISGTQITVTGSGFQATKGSGSSLTINGWTVATTSWSDSQIVGTVPSGATTGPVKVTVNSGISSNLDVLFTIPNPIVTSISPSSGPINTPVTVNGVGFGSPQGSSTLKIGGAVATVSTWSDTQITATVPPAAQNGYVTVTVAGVSSRAGDVYYTIPAPQITSVSPNSGAPGSQVTVNGSGFRPTQSSGGSSSSLYFNGFSAAITTWGDTQIVATVPASATTGPVTISGFNANSNADVVFTTANPVITSLSPTRGPVGTAVQINGSGFGSTAGTVAFSNNAAAITSWTDTQIVASVPTASKSGSVTVTVGGVTSNGNINFTVPPPQITSITPSSGAAGTQVTVTGSGFQASQGSNTIGFTNGSLWDVVTWSDTQIVAKPSAQWGSNAVWVTVNAGHSNSDIVFAEPTPAIASIAPLGGPVNTQVQISGSGFGATTGAVSFNFKNGTIVNWTDSLITVTVAAGTTSGSVRVTAGGVTSQPGPSFFVSNLFINAVSPAAGPVGTPVTITGSGFGAVQGTVKFNSTVAIVSTWSDTQITTSVPTGATSGNVVVTVNGVNSSPNPTFTVGGVVVSGTSPTSGLAGSQVQISGTGFGATQGSSTVRFGGFLGTASSWSDTLITATVPSSAASGPVTVAVGGVSSNTTVNFNVIPTLVAGVSPSSGAPGTQVVVSGSGFGATQGNSTFTFNGVAASIVSWSDTSLTVTVPSTATTGTVSATVGGARSNTNLNFTVPGPQVTSITPTSGGIGTQVTINGSGFGASQGSSSATFNNVLASVVSWSDTQVVATVPASAKTGPAAISGSNLDVIFTLPNPVVSSLSPTSGPMDTQVQINGSGFGATQGSSTLTFNNVAGNVVSWSDTLITARVPSTATSGVVAVTVSGVASPSTISFNVPPPHISGITPGTGPAGTQITITGSGFHATQGPGSVVFNNQVTAPIVSWSDTQIVATVPTTAAGPALSVWQNQYSNSDPGFVLTNPHITGVVPSSGPVGTQVQINGSGFGGTQGSSTVVFGGGWTGTVNSWSDTQITATVPLSATSGPITATVAGVTSNNTVNFTVPAPRITSISPTSGSVGTTLTVTGTGFQSAIGSGSVNFTGTYTRTPISWSDTQIVVAVPQASTTGAISVKANNTTLSNQDFVFTMPNPTVNGLVPSSGPAGTQVQINGSGFGSAQAGSALTFNGVAASVVSWSDTQVVALVPAAATSGPVQITEGGVGSNKSVLFNVPAPVLTSVSPNIGGAGNSVTLTGSGFQAVQGRDSYVTFNGSGTSAAIKSWSDSQIVAVVPAGTVTGSVAVNVNSLPSNYLDYIIPSLLVSTIAPNTGAVGTQVTITGTSFGASQGTSVLTFNGQVASVSSWSDTQIIATVPVTAASGPVVATVNNINSNATVNFTVPPPIVNTYSPEGGVVGTQVTISGSGFQATQRDSTLTFNGTPATITGWSDTQIVATVPSGASTGPMLVNVNAVSSASSNTFMVPNPVITSISPSEAPAGGSITITGSGFGSTYVQPVGSLTYSGFINFNGVNSLPDTWSDTVITVRVPGTATTGPVQILNYNAASNGVPFTIEGTPTVTGLSPSTGAVGSSVTINGTGFGPPATTSSVQFYNGVPAVVTSWSDTQIVATVPPGTFTGEVTVNVAGVSGPGVDFAVSNSVQVIDSLGHTTSYASTMAGGAWHPTFSEGSGCSSCSIVGTLNRDLDSVGHVQSSIDELSHTTSYTYDDTGNVTSELVHLDDGTPVQTSYTYNSFGEPLTVTDPLGNITTNQYDANGNLISVTSPRPDALTAPSVTQFAYDTKGQLTQITDPLNHHTTLDYYPTGLIHTITDDQLNVTTYEYDLRGNRTAVVDAIQNRTTFDYDLGNRLTKISYPDMTFVSFGYDTRGRRTSVTDQNQKTTTYAYDDADRLTSVTDPAQNVTTYAYDTENDLLSITDAAGHTTSFSYDQFRRVTQTTFPAVNSYETYVYDAVGNLTSKTDRKGQTIQYVYDALNRLTHKGYPDTTGVDYIYDLAGKIKQVSDPSGTYGFAYDNMGRLIGTTTQYAFLPGVTYSNSYGYDAASNRTSFTSADNSTVSYGYDDMNRLTNLTDSATGQFTFGYDALSRRTALNRPNGVNTTYSYDSLSRLLSVLHQAGTVTLDGTGYTYDNAGNRTTKTNYLNNITENYTYDPIYQLTQVTQGLTTTESYSYDAVGNRLSSQGMSPYAYNSSNQLTSTPSATFTYDANGNTLTKSDSSGTTQYSFDFENRLTQAVVPSVGTTTFRYDPFGRRIQKSGPLGTTNYVYDVLNVIEEVDNGGNVLADYTHGTAVDETLSMLRGGTTSYDLADGLGSITSLSTAPGALANTYTYDSFGKVTASTGTVTNPVQYTGREFDQETGLYFNRARYYDPKAGRFISEDPTGFEGGINYYPYAFNSPPNLRDPSGRSAAAAAIPVAEGVGTVVCFGSGVCETVVVVGGVVVAVAGTGYLIYNWYESRSRGHSDPIPYPGTRDPGQCDKEPGKCKPCPPDSPYWDQPGNAHGGTTGVHFHWYHWNQKPYPDCTCYPSRMSGGSPPTGGTPWSPGGTPWP